MQLTCKNNFVKWKTILNILTILLFVSLTTEAFAKGCAGTYFIKGIAYSFDKTVLKNATFTVKFGTKIKTISTDSNGHYEIELSWESPCPSGRSKEQQKKDSEKSNPAFIYINFANKEIKLENNWKKYAECHPHSKDAITCKKDLYFTND